MDLAFEVLLSRNMRYLRIAAGPNSEDDSVKQAVRCIVHYPLLAFLIANQLRHLGVEFGSLLETAAAPQLLDLGDNLLAVRVTLLPFD